MKVRATQIGFYGTRRRYPGDEFSIQDSEFSKSWMEKADEDEAEEVKPRRGRKPKEAEDVEQGE